MRESRTYGSVRGAVSNDRPYRDRLMEVFRLDDVAAGVRDAIDRGVIGFDAIKHLVLCRIERRPPRLDMSVYPYLPRASVARTSATTYMDLLTAVTS